MSFFVDLDALRTVKVFEKSQEYLCFSNFFCLNFDELHQTANREKHRKNLCFPKVFLGFSTIDPIKQILKYFQNYEISFAKQCMRSTITQEYPKTSHFLLWELPGLHFGRVWALLGRILPVLGTAWAPLGRSSAALGRLLGASWAPLAPLGRLLGASWAPLGRPFGAAGPSWVPLGALGRILGASWEPLGRFGIASGRVWVGSGPQNNCLLVLIQQGFHSTQNAGHRGVNFQASAFQVQ